MNEVYMLIAGIIMGCLISRYFIGVGSKLHRGELGEKTHEPTDQDNTEQYD